jgi:hypothetical protein
LAWLKSSNIIVRIKKELSVDLSRPYLWSELQCTGRFISIHGRHFNPWQTFQPRSSRRSTWRQDCWVI